MKLIVSEFADINTKELAKYYADIDSSLKASFVLEIQNYYDRISEHPKAFPEKVGAIRAAYIHRFSVGIFYKLYPNYIHVLAVFHTSQDTENKLDSSS